MTPEEKKRRVAELEAKYSRALAPSLLRVLRAEHERIAASASGTQEEKEEAARSATDDALRQAQALHAASIGMGVTDQAARAGLAVAQNVGVEDIRAVTRRAEELAKAQQALGEGKPEAKQKAAEAASRFLASANQLYEALIGDAEAMERIGRGSLERVLGIRESTAQLQELARTASKRAGKTITVEALLAGEGSEDLVQAARGLQSTIRTQIESLQPVFGQQVGKPEQPMTEQEREELAAERERLERLHQFAPGSPEAEQRYEAEAKETMQQLVNMAASAGVNIAAADQESLIREMVRRGSGYRVSTALRAKRKLQDMIAQSPELGALPESAAVARMIEQAEQQGDTERATDLRRWQRQAAPFLDVPTTADKFGATLEERVGSIAGERPPTASAKEKSNVQITGTVTIKNLKEAVLELESVDGGAEGATFPSGVA